MVTTVEPGIYVPKLGGARWEDMVLVTTKGRELLTKSTF
jgi:Xaa-Pro aminopeptidase